MNYITIILILLFVLLLIILMRKKLHSVFDGKMPLIPDFASYNQETQAISLHLDFEKSNEGKACFLIFDLETTGLPIKAKSTPADYPNWPRVIQISWILFDEEGKEINNETHYVWQTDKITAASMKIHHITDEMLAEKGEDATEVWRSFMNDIEKCQYIVTHNNDFDIPIIESELHRIGIFNSFQTKSLICTMQLSKNIIKIPSMDIGRYKEPNLEEMMRFCYFPDFNKLHIEGLHNAVTDTAITAKCFFYFLNNNYLKLKE